MLGGKNILLGITGSIAAYKAALITRLLAKEGAEVQVLMTDASKTFITPLTLSTLSKRPVVSTYADDSDTGVWNNHVELGLWGDAMLIAPASANTLAKMAQGLCDNVLLATYLSARCPVYVAPAMDLDMYKHPATQENLAKLRQHGITIIDPESGELASGLSGQGRMAEPESIVSFLENHLREEAPLAGKKVLISAGPTYEAIDPVRFIGNHSSGKMGFALAECVAALGGEVQLVSGPSSLSTAHPSIHRTNVTSAAEMLEACEQHWSRADIGIMAAAVADYRPAQVADQKMKKKDDALTIILEATKDILKGLGQQKTERQLLVGFALETENELEHAKGKLERKNLDLIVLNSLNDPGAGFRHDTNKVRLIDRQNKVEEFELKSKSEVASDIVRKIISLL